MPSRFQNEDEVMKDSQLRASVESYISFKQDFLIATQEQADRKQLDVSKIDLGMTLSHHLGRVTDSLSYAQNEDEGMGPKDLYISLALKKKVNNSHDRYNEEEEGKDTLKNQQKNAKVRNHKSNFAYSQLSVREDLTSESNGTFSRA